MECEPNHVGLIVTALSSHTLPVSDSAVLTLSLTLSFWPAAVLTLSLTLPF